MVAAVLVARKFCHCLLSHSCEQPSAGAGAAWQATILSAAKVRAKVRGCGKAVWQNRLAFSETAELHAMQQLHKSASSASGGLKLGCSLLRPCSSRLRCPIPFRATTGYSAGDSPEQRKNAEVYSQLQVSALTEGLMGSCLKQAARPQHTAVVVITACFAGPWWRHGMAEGTPQSWARPHLNHQQ